MTVKQIAISAARLLQADDIEELLTSENESAENDADVIALVRCVNLAASELGDCGFSADVATECEAENGVIPFSVFVPAPLKIISVSRNGRAVPFGTDGSGITVERDGEYTVRFAPAHSEYGLDDEVNLSRLCDTDLISCLVARNYCLMTGRTDDASVWDQLYERRAENCRMAKRVKLPSRKWIR